MNLCIQKFKEKIRINITRNQKGLRKLKLYWEKSKRELSIEVNLILKLIIQKRNCNSLIDYLH